MKNEFPCILFLSIILAVFMVLDLSGTVRVALGLPFVLFFPGYTLLAVLFPARDDLDVVERFVLSCGLSIAVVPLLGFMLNYTPWGIRLYPILLTLLLFTILFSGMAIYRRNKLSFEKRFMVSFKVQTIKWGDFGRVDKILSAALVGAIILAAGSLHYVATIPKAGEQFTEFYMLGPGGKAEDYPWEMKTGEEREVTLGTVNHEYRPVTYTAEVRIDGQVATRLEPFQLSHEEKKEASVSFRVDDPHEKLKVEFLLFQDGASDPYQSLHLWVKVHE